MPPIVQIDSAWKRFQQRQRSPSRRSILRNLFRPTFRVVDALVDINLQIESGEIVAYAGPNGAGKSTTVKLLAGLLAPDRGSVRVLGLDPVRDRIRYVKQIGVVFGQRTELWWDQPVSASFEWKRVVWDISQERFDQMSRVVRELLGLNEFFNSLARELSLGQRMRADLGLALLPEPRILFLDEPSLGLDVLARRSILKFIQELNREQGVTVMVTSHDMAELEELAGRIVMIDHGRMAFDGDFDRLRREFGDRRRLLLETDSPTPARLTGAQLESSERLRHEYSFDASKVSLVDLLAEAARHCRVTDVETHRAAIDDVIADIYERWQDERSESSSPGLISPA